MIPLPPGATRNYEIRFTVSELTNEMGEWFNLIGGRAWATEEYDWRGREVTNKYVQYGQAKASHLYKDGTNTTLIRFHGNDAATASVFLLKFFDEILNHNMKDYLEND
jgi:hypothetical protein